MTERDADAEKVRQALDHKQYREDNRCVFCEEPWPCESMRAMEPLDRILARLEKYKAVVGAVEQVLATEDDMYYALIEIQQALSALQEEEG